MFVLRQRFDFATFDGNETLMDAGAVDESNTLVTLQSIANSRATLGMFGSGYIEMRARQMTADLQAIRDATPPGGSRALITKGISFGRIARFSTGNWDVSQVEGLVAPSLQTSGPANPPRLIIRPFHQASNVISLRIWSLRGLQASRGSRRAANTSASSFLSSRELANCAVARKLPQ